MKRCTRFSARTRAESSDRATACSRQPAGAGSLVVTPEILLHQTRELRSLSQKGCSSNGGFDRGVETARAAVRDARLAPHLYRERHGDQRAVEPEQSLGVLGQLVHLELLEIRGDSVRAREGGVVERLQLLHGGREALGVPRLLGGDGPPGEGLEVGELGGENGHGYDAAETRTVSGLRPCA